MSKKLSNRQIGMLLAGTMVLSLAIGSGIRVLTSPDPNTDVATAPTEGTDAAEAEPTVDAESSTAFSSGPLVPASGDLNLADPGLLQSTSDNARIDVVMAGRPDPFAPITRPTGIRLARRQAAASQPALPVTSPPPAPVAQAPLPVVPVTATQTLPPLPSTVQPLPPSPPASLPSTVAVAPTTLPDLPNLNTQSVVEAIEITGVAQIGDQVSIIVKEPGAETSRRVSTGDLLAGGQVRVKQVDLSAQEPVVVLEYEGQDYYRSVGGTSLARAL